MNAQEISDVLTSCWTLAVGTGTRLPSGLDVLDCALKTAIERGNFPEGFKKLRFVETRTGLRCPELVAALSWAQASDQTADPNPAYNTTYVKPSDFVALVILKELGISAEDARRWGNALSQAIKEQQAA
jgi:hypothetical protein